MVSHYTGQDGCSQCQSFLPADFNSWSGKSGIAHRVIAYLRAVVLRLAGSMSMEAKDSQHSNGSKNPQINSRFTDPMRLVLRLTSKHSIRDGGEAYSVVCELHSFNENWSWGFQPIANSGIALFPSEGMVAAASTATFPNPH